MEIVTQTAGAVTGFLHNPLRNTQLNDGDFKRESAPIERGNSPSLAPPAEPPKPATPRGPRNLKLRAALRLAKLHNLAIFPAKPNEKTPAFVGWQGAATSNAEAITKWWTENPDFNIGVSTQGLLVLDVDARKGGIENFKVWRDLMELAGDVLPKTLRVKTASGGLHYIFKLPHGVLIGNKTNRPVEGVDIRGNGGLIVGAGSTIKKSEDEPLNTYTILDDVPIAEAPEWLIEAIGRGRPKAASAGKRVAEETDEMVAKAEVWLHGRAPEEITEGNRDNGLYTVAAKLYDFGLRQATVQGMLAQ